LFHRKNLNQFQLSELENLVNQYRNAEDSLLVKQSSKFFVESVTFLTPAALRDNSDLFTNQFHQEQHDTIQPSINHSHYKSYVLEHVDLGTKTYRNEFIGKLYHRTYIGPCGDLGPVIISMAKGISYAKHGTYGGMNEEAQEGYHVILRSKIKPDIRKFVPEPDSSKHNVLLAFSKSAARVILSSIHPELQVNQLKRVPDKEVEKKILELDEMRVSFRGQLKYSC
jgi:hypothetical protein